MEVTDPQSLVTAIGIDLKKLKELDDCELVEIRQPDGHDEVQLHHPAGSKNRPDQRLDTKQCKERFRFLAKKTHALSQYAKDHPDFGVNVSDLISRQDLITIFNAVRRDGRFHRIPLIFESLHKVAVVIEEQDLAEVFKLEKLFSEMLQTNYEESSTRKVGNWSPRSSHGKRTSPKQMLVELSDLDVSLLDGDQFDQIAIIQTWAKARLAPVTIKRDL